jgi:hypothetical protein
VCSTVRSAIGKILQLAETEHVSAGLAQFCDDLGALMISSAAVAAPRLPRVVKKFSTLALTILKRAPALPPRPRCAVEGFAAFENVTGAIG